MRTENAAALRGERDQPGCSDKYPPPNTHTPFQRRKQTSVCNFFCFLPLLHACVPRADAHRGRADEKCANKHASHITTELPLAWLLIKPAAPIRDYKD